MPIPAKISRFATQLVWKTRRRRPQIDEIIVDIVKVVDE